MSLYYLPNARSQTQREHMERLERDGICSFCPDGIKLEQDVTWRTAHWTALDNQYPYQGADQQLIVVPNRHVEAWDELELRERNDFGQALLSRFHGLVMRNGPPEETGATIRHLHAHLIWGGGDVPIRVKVYVPARDRVVES
jgi:diadenosine tetraphosphate (Ap4A) HIT family hydrolase